MTEFEKAQAELEEAKILKSEGFVFDAGGREFHIRPLLFGTIAHANKYAVQLKINIHETDQKTLFEGLDSNINPMMHFIATCILGDYWKIKLFTGLLARYLKWKLKPDDALKIIMVILQMYDIANFIKSIGLLGKTTLTTPKVPNPTDMNSVD